MYPYDDEYDNNKYDDPYYDEYRREDIFVNYTGPDKPKIQLIKDWFRRRHNSLLYFKVVFPEKIKQVFIRIGKAIWFTLIDVDGKYKRSHEDK